MLTRFLVYMAICAETARVYREYGGWVELLTSVEFKMQPTTIFNSQELQQKQKSRGTEGLAVTGHLQQPAAASNKDKTLPLESR